MKPVVWKGRLLLLGRFGDNSADSAGALEKKCGFSSDDFKIFFFGNMHIPFSHELVNFALGHVFADLGKNFCDFEIAGVSGKKARSCQKKISDQHWYGDSPNRIGHLFSPAQGGAVHDIVVEEGGGVQVFKYRWQPEDFFILIMTYSRRKNEQQGPQPLPAAEYDMARHFGYEIEIRAQVFFEGFFNLVEIVLYNRNDFFFQ